jgi:hypothetical protein
MQLHKSANFHCLQENSGAYNGMSKDVQPENRFFICLEFAIENFRFLLRNSSVFFSFLGVKQERKARKKRNRRCYLHNL